MIYLYLAFLALFYVVFRKRIEVVFPLVLIRSKKFVEEIDVIGRRYKNYWFILFRIGIVIGVIMMAYSLYYLSQGVLRLKVETVPRLGLLIPGTKMGGITFPLVQGIVALFIILTAHEFGHGIASAAEGVKPKHMAVVFLLGLVPGGGVEVDYDKLGKKGWRSKLAVLCAGSTVNILLALMVLLANRPLMEVGKTYLATSGMQIIKVEEGSPSYSILQPGMVIENINGVNVTTIEDMKNVRNYIAPNSTVNVGTTNGTYVVGTDPKGMMGFQTVPYYTIIDTPVSKAIFWIMDLFSWIFITSIGLGVANMMPLIPFDGGYLAYEVLKNLKAERLVKFVYLGTLALVFLNLFSSQIRAILL